MNVVQLVSVAILPLILAITVHEAAHGWVAYRLGDPTAKSQGRLTFNPLPHIDLIGTIVVPMVLLLLGGFIFGWAKPVPVDLRNFKRPRHDMAIVALAGPTSNLLMALAWGMVVKLAIVLPESLHWMTLPLILMGKIGMTLNIILAVLNFLPLPPLDGSRILAWLLPTQGALMLDRIEPYGIFILIGLLYLGIWDKLISPLVNAVNAMMMTALSLPM